jgi:RHS repeat-associated protein
MFLTMGDHLGSATVTVDATTSEVVERATFQPFGAMESDYRPDRWADQRELYKFTGKEEDIEVGATYFGARYYQPHLGRFMSADPLAVHGMGGDLNPYAYVRGRVMTHVDPLGLEDEAVAAAAAAGAGETPQPETNHPEGVYERTSVQIIQDPCGGPACADAQVARSRTGFGFDPPSTRAPVGNLLGVPPDGARTDDVIGRGMKDTVTSRDWRGPEIQKTIAPMGQAGGAVLLAALYIVVLPEVLAAAEEAAVAAAAAAGVREAAEPEERVRSGLAAAIAAAADDEVIADVIALARDARHGSSRLLLLSALERSADPRARAALIELGADPDLTKEVHVILRRLTC